jgi:hypothetical protein
MSSTRTGPCTEPGGRPWATTDRTANKSNIAAVPSPVAIELTNHQGGISPTTNPILLRIVDTPRAADNNFDAPSPQTVSPPALRYTPSTITPNQVAARQDRTSHMAHKREVNETHQHTP